MKKFIIILIKIYQKTLSPLLGNCCRYNPTCSSYALTAIERFGLIKGGKLALIRILKCNPFFKGGEDPVPDCIDKKEP